MKFIFSISQDQQVSGDRGELRVRPELQHQMSCTEHKLIAASPSSSEDKINGRRELHQQVGFLSGTLNVRKRGSRSMRKCPSQGTKAEVQTVFFNGRVKPYLPCSYSSMEEHSKEAPTVENWSDYRPPSYFNVILFIRKPTHFLLLDKIVKDLQTVDCLQLNSY